MSDDLKLRPDYKGFTEAICGEWPVGDVDGFDVFEAAVKHRIILEVPGGYDPDSHFDAHGTEPEPGDPWYEWNTRPEPSLADAARVLLDAKQLPSAYAVYGNAPDRYSKGFCGGVEAFVKMLHALADNPKG